MEVSSEGRHICPLTLNKTLLIRAFQVCTSSTPLSRAIPLPVPPSHPERPPPHCPAILPMPLHCLVRTVFQQRLENNLQHQQGDTGLPACSQGGVNMPYGTTDDVVAPLVVGHHWIGLLSLPVHNGLSKITPFLPIGLVCKLLFC